MSGRITSDERVVILGSGPTGLGAGYRLLELGHENFPIYERGRSGRRSRDLLPGRAGLYVGHRWACPVFALRLLRPADGQSAEPACRSRLADPRARILGMDRRPLCAVSVSEQHPLPV